MKQPFMSQVDQAKEAKEDNKGAVHTVFMNVDVPESTEEVTRKGWVKWGKDNLYPQFLWYLVYHSPIHQGIISTKVDYIVSGGLEYDGSEAEFEEILKNGKSKYTLDEVVEMMCLDNEVSNSHNLHCKKDILTGKWYIDPIDFELLRPNEDQTLFYYSEDWSTDRQDPEKTGYKEILSFFNRLPESTECILQVKTKSRQQKPLETKKVTGGFFSIPSYSGGIDSILTDIEINFFRYAEVVNGYKGGAIIYLGNGIPASEQIRKDVLRDLKIDATDRKKRGGIAVSWGEGDEQKPFIAQVNGNDLDKRYESTESGLLIKIMIAHGVINPKLFGVMSNNAMSETDDEASFNRWQKTYGNKRRKQLSDSLNYALSKLNGMTGKLSLKVPSLDLVDDGSQVALAINSASPLVANKILDSMTPNEIRQYLAKLPPIEGGDVLQPSVDDVSQQMKAQESVLSHFRNYGRQKSGLKFLNSREHLSFEVDDDAEYVEQFLSDRMAFVSKIQLAVLQLLSEGMSLSDIANELVLSNDDLNKHIKALEKGGYTEGSEITTKGEIEIVNQETVEVVYSYEKRPDAPDLVAGGESREFCKELIKLDRVYTRSEIDSISSAIGRNVWLYRGGWYHNPNTDKNQPSCRHRWESHILKRSK
jgi:DNA-binding Lrp family transcriptional regulator